MKRIKIICLILTLIIVASIIFSGCGMDYIHPDDARREPYQSAYTMEEHRQKLYKLAEETNEYKKQDYIFYETKVYIMYSFDENPEYFLVQRYYQDKYDDKAKSSYVFGYIYNDEYYVFRRSINWTGHDETKEGSGINPYIYAGISDEQKKYYADCFVFAWETEDGKIEGFKVAGMGNNCSHYVFLEDTIVEYDSKVREKLKKTRYLHSRWAKKVEKGVFDIK